MSSRVYVLVAPADVRSEVEKYLHQHKIEFIKKAGEELFTYTVTIPYQRATAISKKFITVVVSEPSDESLKEVVDAVKDGGATEPDSPDMDRFKDMVEQAKYLLKDKWWIAALVVAAIVLIL